MKVFRSKKANQKYSRKAKTLGIYMKSFTKLET